MAFGLLAPLRLLAAQLLPAHLLLFAFPCLPQMDTHNDCYVAAIGHQAEDRAMSGVLQVRLYCMYCLACSVCIAGV